MSQVYFNKYHEVFRSVFVLFLCALFSPFCLSVSLVYVSVFPSIHLSIYPSTSLPLSLYHPCMICLPIGLCAIRLLPGPDRERQRDRQRERDRERDPIVFCDVCCHPLTTHCGSAQPMGCIDRLHRRTRGHSRISQTQHRGGAFSLSRTLYVHT